MNVALVWITPNPEQTILYCARVSSPHQDSQNTKLLNYLIKNKHWSPFEMASMCVEITTSRAIARQILRHRSFSFQEFSQRYTQPALHTEIPVARYAAKSNRQSSTVDVEEELRGWWETEVTRVINVANMVYVMATERGIATESARFILPEMTQTHLYMAGTMRSWIHYYLLRRDLHTQQEHREIANNIGDILREQIPITMSAIEVED